MLCEVCHKDFSSCTKKLHFREGRFWCVPCWWEHVMTTRDVEVQGDAELTLTATLATVATATEKKVRVPETCEGCGFVEGPDATRRDQVFLRYGRKLCRRCRRQNRDGQRRYQKK